MIGGGQLARMMAQPAIALGVPLRLLAEAEGVSAAQVIPDHVVGDYTDLDTLRKVTDGCAVVTFDHEHVPTEHLHELETAGVPCRPGPGALVHAQDKGVMRARLTELGAPCPRHAIVTTVEDIEAFGLPCVLKITRGGYDGKGVWFVRSAADCAEPLAAAAERGVGLLAEELVDFRRELSALVARSPSGQAAAYPVVASTQRDGICHEVVAPAPDLDPALATEAQQVALRIAGELDVTGILAVEMFETTDGRILVNELAMRPHNTGHWTQDGCGDLAVREPPARGARPAPRVARRPGAVDGDGQHPRRSRAPTSGGSTTATRTRWPAIRTCACTSTARSCGPAARSATSTPTATTWTTASNARAMPRHGSPET